MGTILAIVFSILLMMAVILSLFLWWRNQRKRQKAEAQAEEQGAARQETPWRMVVPDVRLYKETELQVEVEYATPLDECFNDDYAHDSPHRKHPLDPSPPLD